MCGFETRFPTDDDAERIMSTFYAFVEEHGQDVDGDAHLRTEMDGDSSKVLVRLWSAEAMDAFLGALAKSIHSPRKAVYE